jgi:hypothetical protein
MAATQLLLLDGSALGLSHWLRGFVRRHRWSALGMARMTLRHATPPARGPA